MTATLGEGVAARGGEEFNVKASSAEAEEAVEQTAEQRWHERIHRALSLTADQAIVGEVAAYNTFHTNRAGQRIPGGGELVVVVKVDGPDTDHPSTRIIEIRDGERGGIDEDTITELGAKAQAQPKVERIVL